MTGWTDQHVRQRWRKPGSFSEEYVFKRILTNIHSVSELRVNGIVSQMDEWYDAYNIKAGDKMYLAPSERVKIWNK